MRITRVVTRTGDSGETSLARGSRVSKDSPRVTAYGEVDELNSWLGVVRAHPLDGRLSAMLEEIQHQLFVLGADLATPPEFEGTRVEQHEIDRLEAFLEELLEVLDPLQEFVLPGGGKAGSFLQVARAVARRAERSAVTLARQAPAMSHEVVIYLNRLSDLLFVMARVANHLEGAQETQACFSKKPPRATDSATPSP